MLIFLRKATLADDAVRIGVVHSQANFCLLYELRWETCLATSGPSLRKGNLGGRNH